MKVRPVTIIILLCSIAASIFYINHQASVTTIHSVDMVTYDSVTKKMCILDSGRWNCYDIVGSYTDPPPPPIDWEWFKKGYVPKISDFRFVQDDGGGIYIDYSKVKEWELKLSKKQK